MDDSEDCRPTPESGDGTARAVVGSTKNEKGPGADLDAVLADQDLGSIQSCDEREGEAGAGQVEYDRVAAAEEPRRPSPCGKVRQDRLDQFVKPFGP
ncbi:hypothetical protein [Nocardia farcinica]|uniref:hypothetical protein n=1 Tax=Nocardia farcinica TaxID=37329 RepID=UPI001894990A|nr:hypothetical protein [Nocardia farcinica]MBF6410861.1 hypothetical protein [Nocardia farcinica]UEX26028.1 hypothetical protein LMJ57_29725 [Nocardia farcinica]